MTEWGRNWRKLYVHPSTAWLAMPYSARGLGYEIIRVCDADGRISCGALTPQEAIARLCQVATNNRKQMHSDYRALVADGFILVETIGEGDSARHTVIVRNFVEAQSEKRPSKAAARSAQGTAKVPLSPGYDAPMTQRSMGVSARNDSSENDRLEEIRREETKEEILEETGTPTTTPAVPVVVPPPKQGLVVPGPDELTDTLRRASKGKIEAGIGQGRDELLALKAFATQRAKEGCDVLAEFRTLGEAIDAGIVQKQFPGAPSLLRWLGKPEADGTRPARALVSVLGIANEWKRAEEKKRAELEASRKPSVPQELSDCEKRELQSQATLALAHLAKLKAEADLSKPTKAPVRPAGAGPMFGVGVRTNPPPPVDSRPPTETN